MKNNRKSIVQHRRAEIIQAAKKVFLKKGFRNTTMEDVIHQTSLSKGGFYHYFKSTKDISFAIMDGLILFELQDMLVQCKAKRFSNTRQRAEFITKYLVDFMFRESEEQKLYIIFLTEIPYDKTYLEMFNNSQMKAVKGIVNYLRDADAAIPPDEVIIPKLLFIGRILNSIAIGRRLFNAKESFKKHRGFIQQMMLSMVLDLIGQ